MGLSSYWLSAAAAIAALTLPTAGLADPVAGAPATIATQGLPASQPDGKPAPDPNKKICRRDPDTGSHIPGHTCHTRAEWDAIEAQTAQQYQDLRQRSDNGGGGPVPVGH